ncbi:hypothetical protein AURDEDRAFT_170127 [Auricularia subglabra TFB-10046 SS5]|nr:hypothetical protein AURDEDRAFT_170127 [Auricularia subglabra TFB-10046 SS5]
MLSGWNKTLDILLIFAGVFSAVATTFIVDSNGQLRPDWNQYSANLLYAALSAQAAAGNTNMVLPTPAAFAAIPVSSMSRWISGLWVCSLAISLVVSLFCILAKQWLIEYHTRVSGSARSAQQWSRRRSLFFVGLEAWRLPLIFAALPALLHLSLFLFMVGLVLFFWALHRILALCLLAITCCVALFYVVTSLVTFYDIACPYYISLFHQLHAILGHFHGRAYSSAHYVTHVTEAGKIRLDAATLAWLSAASMEQDVIAASVTAIIENFSSVDSSPVQHPPDPTHMHQLLEALCAVSPGPGADDTRMDAALVILRHALAVETMDELMLRRLVYALLDLCISYPGSPTASPVPITIGDARFDAIALLSHIAVEGTHYSLMDTDLPAVVISRIWTPDLFDARELTWPSSESMLKLSVESSAVVLPLAMFVASPAFLAAQWTEDDIATVCTIFVQPFPDVAVGGQAILSLLHVAVQSHATFSPIFGVIECIRANPAASIAIVDASSEILHPWRQLCCSLDSPSMSERDRKILAPLLLECGIALGTEIWRQYTGTESATRLGRELLDADCITPLLRGPLLANHWRKLNESSFILRGRITGMHSAEHLFLNIMPALLPDAWQATWDDIVARFCASDIVMQTAAVVVNQRGLVLLLQDPVTGIVGLPRSHVPHSLDTLLKAPLAFLSQSGYRVDPLPIRTPVRLQQKPEDLVVNEELELAFAEHASTTPFGIALDLAFFDFSNIPRLSDGRQSIVFWYTGIVRGQLPDITRVQLGLARFLPVREAVFLIQEQPHHDCVAVRALRLFGSIMEETVVILREPVPCKRAPDSKDHHVARYVPHENDAQCYPASMMPNPIFAPATPNTTKIVKYAFWSAADLLVRTGVVVLSEAWDRVVLGPGLRPNTPRTLPRCTRDDVSELLGAPLGALQSTCARLPFPRLSKGYRWVDGRDVPEAYATLERETTTDPFFITFRTWWDHKMRTLQGSLGRQEITFWYSGSFDHSRALPEGYVALPVQEAFDELDTSDVYAWISSRVLPWRERFEHFEWGFFTLNLGTGACVLLVGAVPFDFRNREALGSTFLGLNIVFYMLNKANLRFATVCSSSSSLPPLILKTVTICP